MAEQYEEGSFSDTKTRRTYRPFMLSYNPMVDAILKTMVATGLVSICAIFIAEASL